MECIACHKDTHTLAHICDMCSTVRRPKDGKSVGKINFVKGRLIFTTWREKEHIFRKYNGFGLTVLSPIQYLLHIMEKLHQDDVFITIEFGKKQCYGFKAYKHYKTTLMAFVRDGIEPPLTETEGERQKILNIKSMKEIIL